MTPMFVVVAILAVMFGLLRVVGVVSPVYRDFAHIFVGFLYGTYAGGKDKNYLWLALGLTAVEVVMFLATRAFHVF